MYHLIPILNKNQKEETNIFSVKMLALLVGCLFPFNIFNYNPPGRALKSTILESESFVRWDSWASLWDAVNLHNLPPPSPPQLRLPVK